MEKQTYQNKISYLKKEKLSIQNEILAIRKIYIDKNKKFEIGDRVRTKGGEIGIVYGFDLDWKDNVKPLMYKEKKDGSQSKFKLYAYYESDVIGLAEDF